jgi:hypothetical protein
MILHKHPYIEIQEDNTKNITTAYTSTAKIQSLIES